MKIDEITVTELSEITGIKKYNISAALRSYKENEVTRKNNRVTGISPNAVEKFLLDNEIDAFTMGSIFVVANLCGGVGKTTCAYSLTAAIRRLTSLKTAIVMIDGDSQGSLSRLADGSWAADDDATLSDYIEGRVLLSDILIELGDNTWIIKSNLGLAVLDKLLQSPKDTKTKMLRLYNEIFKLFGSETKIIQDHGPQLSNLFASSICALYQINKDLVKTVLVPIRSDDFAIQGAEIIVKEMKDLVKTFGLSRRNNVEIKCFFSNLDKRVSSTAKAVKAASEKTLILDHLCESAIRYSSEIPKAIMSGSNVFQRGKAKAKAKASQDYSQLLVELFCSEEMEICE